jgi:hypothetical protein
MPAILPPKRLSAKTGLNMLDLTNASREQMTLIKIILKRVNVTEKELWDEVQALPEKHRMDRGAFDQAIEQLVESKWLWKTGSGEKATYSPRLQKRVSRVRLQTQMSQRSGNSFGTLWTMLETRAGQEQTATGASPTQPALASRLSEFFSSRMGSRQILWLMLFLSAVNSFALASVDVSGVSGFVESIGTQYFWVLNIAEMLLSLFVSAVYIQFADRIPRVRLMKILLAGMGVTYLFVGAFFALATYTQAMDGLGRALGMEDARALLYPLLYLIRSQQVIIFPIAFWNLANNLYSMSEARNVFPMLASGDMLGGLVGYSLFTELFGMRAIFSSEQAAIPLLGCAALLVLNLGLFQAGLKEPAKQEDDNDEKPEEDDEKISFWGNIQEGMQTIRQVPLFRHLAVAVAFIWMVFPLLDYHFYHQIELTPNSNFENFYSLYNIAMMLVPLILQWRLVPGLMKRVETKNAFIALPIILVIGTAFSLGWVGIASATTAVLLGYIVLNSWDTPMMSTLQNLIPEERRARVSTLLNNYSYAAGKIAGSLVLGLTLWAGSWVTFRIEYLTLGITLLAALGALASAWLARNSYENSMLSWRVARRARSSSLLDKLSE